MPALKVNIIFVHPRGVVFPRDLYISAGINGFIILKLSFFFCITLISFDKCEHFCNSQNGSTGHTGGGHFIHTYTF